MATYVLELGCEEIPARFVPGFLQQLADGLEKSFTDARILTNGSVSTYATYRRLTVCMDGVVTAQEDVVETLLGPPMAIAKGDSGEWLPPALGFAKRAGVDLDALGVGHDAKGRDVVSVTVTKKGRPVSDVIQECVESVVAKLQLPIAMYWGDHEGPFIRPIHWIVSLLDADVVPVTLFGVNSGNKSRGHRFLSQGEDACSGQWVAIPSADGYVNALTTVKVMVDPQDREAVITDGLHSLAKQTTWDGSLLQEVVYLVEWPTCLVGSFSKKYLDLPADVLVACMKKHQKYFPLYENGGSLQPSPLTNQFMVVADNITADNTALILIGNERVLVARLEDSVFFWDEDVKQSFDQYVQQLDKVMFQKNMGSIGDKVTRIQALSVWLCDHLHVSTSDRESASRVSRLCKADLVTQMVFEFPDLQGEIGAHYAVKSGESDAVALGIREHYYPRSESDHLPTSVAGWIVGIADRLDTIVCCYENKLIPTGSKDPWGIRRAMLGISRILIDHKVALDVESAIDHAYKVLGKSPTHKDKLMSFYKERLKQFFDHHPKGFSKDTVSACLSVSSSPYRLFTLISVIETCRQSDTNGFKQLVDTAIRVSRLVSKSSDTNTVINEDLFEKDIEHKAYKDYQSVVSVIDTNIDVSARLESLITFSEVLSTYFDDVMVMCEEDALKQNRLAFLRAVSNLFVDLGDPDAYQL